MFEYLNVDPVFSTTKPAYKTLLLLPECFDYESEVNSGSLSINYGAFCVLSKPLMS